MVNFTAVFYPCAQVLKPLTDLLKEGAKTLEWTTSAQEAFQTAKRLLAVAVPLQHPPPNAELSLATDVSDTHIRGVMQQKSGDHWRPLVFFSRKLTDTESRYSTFDHKLLPAQAAIKHFHHFCEGRAFQLWTDHKPFVTAISHVSAPISPTQQRLLAFISEFNVQLLYLPSFKNVVADFLSQSSLRLPYPHMEESTKFPASPPSIHGGDTQSSQPLPYPWRRDPKFPACPPPTHGGEHKVPSLFPNPHMEERPKVPCLSPTHT
jgi:cleavage and polyadenylation specificity factor subunit 1